MKIKFLGHACLSIHTNGKHILVDPFITANELANDIDLDTINPDYILLTHAHQDHVLDVELFAKKTKATIISNFEIVDYYAKKGIENGHPMNTGGTWQFDFGKLKALAANHSSTFEDGSNGGCPNGYLLESEGKCVYIAGDTSLMMDMKLIPMLAKPLDLAILPIGDNFTMGITDAIIASDFVACNRVLGYHFDTFGYIKINHQQAIEQFKQKDKELILLKIGETLEV